MKDFLHRHASLVGLTLLFLFLFGTWQSELLAWSDLYLLVWGLVLADHDLRSQSYPLWLWLLGTALFLPFFPITTTSIILFLLAILAEVKDIKLGSGDLLYLATLSLRLDLSQLLWLVQVASLLGIAWVYRTQKKDKALAFIPFLLVGHVTVLLLNGFI